MVVSAGACWFVVSALSSGLPNIAPSRTGIPGIPPKNAKGCRPRKDRKRSPTASGMVVVASSLGVAHLVVAPRQVVLVSRVQAVVPNLVQVPTGRQAVAVPSRGDSPTDPALASSPLKSPGHARRGARNAGIVTPLGSAFIVVPRPCLDLYGKRSGICRPAERQSPSKWRSTDYGL